MATEGAPCKVKRARSRRLDRSLNSKAEGGLEASKTSQSTGAVSASTRAPDNTLRPR